jgi:hypothetical protein
MTHQRIPIAILLCLCLPLLPLSCSSHRAHVRHADYADEMLLSAESLDGEVLGSVAANEAGALWNDCSKSVRGTLWHLMDRTEAMGGNAVGNIRWLPKSEKRATALPTCKKGWGWVLVWPVVLTPVFMSSRAEATAYRIAEPGRAAAGLYVIPGTPAEREALIDRILADAAAP